MFLFSTLITKITNRNRNYDIWVWYLYKCILPFNASLRKGNVYLSNHGCYYTQACHQVVFIRFLFVKNACCWKFSMNMVSLLLTVTHAQFILSVPRWRVHALFCISVCRFGFRSPYVVFDKCPVLFIFWMFLVYSLLWYFFMIISFNTFVLPILMGVFGQYYFNAMHDCYSEC